LKDKDRFGECRTAPQARRSPIALPGGMVFRHVEGGGGGPAMTPPE